MFSTIQLTLTPLSFGLLFFLMLLYWGQAAFFSYTKYKKFSSLVFYLSFASITSLLALRWVESGHFPLSNLYESLLFLSWSFLLGQLILQSHNTSPIPQNKSNNVPDLQKDEYEFVHLLGVVVSPLALISYAFAFINLPKEMQKATSLVPALQSNWLMMHVTIMILSYAALLCGSILSMAFLLIKFTLSRESHANLLLGRSLRQQTTQTSVERGNGYLSYLSQAVVGESAYATGSANARSAPPSIDLNQDVSTKPAPEQKDVLKDSFKLASKGVETLVLETPGVVEPLTGAAYADQLRRANNSDERLFSLCFKLDNLSYRMLGLGFPLLTVGILSGAVWANSAWGSYWSLDPKETWALITWLVFAIYLHARITKGWSGDKPAIIATVGFFVVWFSYLGVNLIGTGLHSYGWFSA